MAVGGLIAMGTPLLALPAGLSWVGAVVGIAGAGLLLLRSRVGLVLSLTALAVQAVGLQKGAFVLLPYSPLRYYLWLEVQYPDSVLRIGLNVVAVFWMVWLLWALRGKERSALSRANLVSKVPRGVSVRAAVVLACVLLAAVVTLLLAVGRSIVFMPSSKPELAALLENPFKRNWTLARLQRLWLLDWLEETGKDPVEYQREQERFHELMKRNMGLGTGPPRMRVYGSWTLGKRSGGIERVVVATDPTGGRIYVVFEELGTRSSHLQYLYLVSEEGDWIESWEKAAGPSFGTWLMFTELTVSDINADGWYEIVGAHEGERLSSHSHHTRLFVYRVSDPLVPLLQISFNRAGELVGGRASWRLREDETTSASHIELYREDRWGKEHTLVTFAWDAQRREFVPVADTGKVRWHALPLDFSRKKNAESSAP